MSPHDVVTSASDVTMPNESTTADVSSDTAQRPCLVFATNGGAEADAALRFVAADLIAVGQHGHGVVDRFLFGSVAQAMVRSAQCAVLVAPPTKK